MLIKVFCVLSMLNKLSSRGVLEGGGGGAATGLLNKGGGSNRLPGLVTKQQAVEFPQVLTSITYILIGDACMEVEYYICQYNLFLYFLYR